jgi:hypothetical protein
MKINYENGVERNCYLSDLSSEVLTHMSDNNIEVELMEYNGNEVYSFYRDGDVVYECVGYELKDVTISDL